MADDDEFSDGGFEDLNDTVLQALEENAIQFTQARFAQSQAAPRPAVDALDLDDDDLDDTVVIDGALDQLIGPDAAPVNSFNNSLNNSIHHASARPPNPAARPGPPRHKPGLNATATAAAARGQPWETHHRQPACPPRPSQQPFRPPLLPMPSQQLRQQQQQSQYPPRPNVPSRPPPTQSQFARPPQPPVPRPFGTSAWPSQVPHAIDSAKPNDVIVALQAQLASLQNDLTSTKGEAAILRSRLEKESKGHEAELGRLRKQHAEEQAKHERAVEAALAAERTTSTELHFARQDLDQELGRARTKKKSSSATTPKKSRHRDMGDGFDHVEVLPSPDRAASRAAQRRAHHPGPIPLSLGDRTPTKGKRKRPVLDSPVHALEMQSDDVLVPDHKSEPDSSHANPQQASAAFKPSQLQPLDFLRVVLDYTSLHGEPLTFDLLGRFSFPSNSSETFATIIFQKLPRMGGGPENPVRLLVDFCDLMLDMWRQCLSEKYYPPIYYLAALITFTLQLNTVEVAPHIIATLVPVCCTTCSLVAVPRFNSPTGDLSLHQEGASGPLLSDINVLQSLSLLYLVAAGCSSLLPPEDVPTASDLPPMPPPQSPQVEFWQSIEPEFVNTMLSLKQHDLDVIGMLLLLCTSVLQESVGPLAKSHDGQALSESAARSVVDNISCHLVELSPWTYARPARQCRLRLAALETLAIFATIPFGALQIAGSAVAIGRLVTLLCWAIDRLYDTDVPLAVWCPIRSGPPANAGYGHAQATRREELAVRPTDMDLDISDADGQAQRPAASPAYDQLAGDEGGEQDESDVTPLLYQLICRAIRLLHTLVTGPMTANSVSMAEKLGASHGGAQRYLLTLARLNFCDGDLVLDSGIDSETGDLANELLEMVMTPDEGEELEELFCVA